jgi:predicted O-linked N-acetylglucosamine transferase (SPINDLY family)
VGTPVVTWPGEFHCGRLTLSLYQEMGIHDCVANSLSDYVKIAVRLGTDAAYRKKIKAKILKNNHRLFENRQVVKEYERVFLAMMKAACAPLSARSRSKKNERGGERAAIPQAVKKTLRKKKSRR